MAIDLTGTNFASLVALLPCVLSILFLLLSQHALRQTTTGRYFLLLCGLVILWSLGSFRATQALSESEARIWIHASTAGLLAFPSFCYLFNRSLLRPGSTSVLLGIGLAAVAVLFEIFHLAMNVFVAGARPLPWGYFPRYTAPFVGFLLYFAVIEALILRDSWRRFRSSLPGLLRSRDRLLFSAWAVSALGSLDLAMGYGVTLFPVSGLCVSYFLLVSFLLLDRYGLSDFFHYRGLGSILQSAIDPVLLISQDGNVQNVSLSTAKALGHPDDGPLRGKPVNSLFSARTPLYTKARSETLSQHRELPILDLMLQSPSGELTPVRFRLSGVFNRWNELIGLVAMGRDVRNEYLKEQELVRANRSLEEKIREAETGTCELTRANRTLEENRTAMINMLEDMEESQRRLEEAYLRLEELDRTKDAFLSSVSHELRTPLTSIRSFSEILLRYPQEQETTRQEFLQIIHHESERLTRLVNDLLDLAKIESGKTNWRRDCVNIQDLFQRALLSLSVLAGEKNLKITCSVADAVPDPRLDKDRVFQVICNLLTNAIKFTPAGGSIRLTAEKIAGKRRGDRSRPLVLIQVTDTGQGIAPEDLPRVFDKFQQGGDTLHEKPQGTGLGLAICREIVQHYQGEIWVTSEPGRGSCFSFTLPLTDDTDAGESVPGAHSRQPSAPNPAAGPDAGIEPPP